MPCNTTLRSWHMAGHPGFPGTVLVLCLTVPVLGTSLVPDKPGLMVTLLTTLRSLGFYTLCEASSLPRLNHAPSLLSFPLHWSKPICLYYFLSLSKLV